MNRSYFNMQEIEFITGKMKLGKCPCFTIQSLTFAMKTVNSMSHFNVAEKKEVTPFILITAVIDTPLESLQLLGLV